MNRNSKSPLQRLHDWYGTHKANSYSISADDGYGAVSTLVELWGTFPNIKVAEGSESDYKCLVDKSFNGGEYPDRKTIDGYTVYEYGEYIYVIGKDGKCPTVEDLLCVAMAYVGVD